MINSIELTERAQVRAALAELIRGALPPDLLEMWLESGIEEKLVDRFITRRRLLRAMGLPIETKMTVMRQPAGIKLTLDVPVG